MSRWADKKFYLSPESSGTEGRWETRPYQRAIMDCMGIDDIETLTWMKPGRVGYSKIIVASIGYQAEHKKRNQILWQPTDGDAHDFVADEIDPMLRDCPAVGGLLKVDPEKKSKFNTTSKKGFRGSTLDIKGGKSSKNYRRMTKDVAYYDELEGFDSDIDHQGDATKLGDKRLTQSPFPKSIRGSTPTLQDGSQIEKSLNQADMRFHRFLSCPECSQLQELSWHQIKMDDMDPTTARHECLECGHGVKYAEYEDMDAVGVWRSVERIRDTDNFDQTGFWIDESGDECVLRNDAGELVDWPDHVGFWCWGAYSYDLTWEKMAAEFVEANEEKKRGQIEDLKTFVNMRLAQTWQDDGEKVQSDPLYQRREHYRAPVPDGVQALTAFVDVQDDRFECEVDGWGFGEQSWAIEYFRLYGDLTKQVIWDQLAERLRKTYSDRHGVMHDIKLVGVDSGGHFTDEVYQFSKKHGPLWIVPTKGSSERSKPVAAFPRKPNAKGVYLTMVGADTAKEIVYNRYLITEPGPGYMHWPVSDEFDEAYFKQATAERKKPRYARGIKYYVWDAGKRRNEATDCKVGNLVCIRLLQQHSGFVFDEIQDTEEAGPDEPTVQTSAKQEPPSGETYKDGHGVTRRRSSYW